MKMVPGIFMSMIVLISGIVIAIPASAEVVAAGTSSEKPQAVPKENTGATSVKTLTQTEAGNLSEMPPTSVLQVPGADFSPLELYRHADAVGKTVITLLTLGSVLSWSVWLGKSWGIFLYRRRVKKSSLQLLKVYSLRGKKTEVLASSACSEIFSLAETELPAIKKEVRQSVADNIKERVHARILRQEATQARLLTRGVGILATTTAIAPFVGLFGTVWGIMHSFSSIAHLQSTSLSVVAPGIAESLFATALGLAVAIPSVIFYNMIARSISGARQELTDVSILIMCLLSKDLEYGDEESVDHHHDIKCVV